MAKPWAWPPAEPLMHILQKSASVTTRDFIEDFTRLKRGGKSRGTNLFSSEWTEGKDKK